MFVVESRPFLQKINDPNFTEKNIQVQMMRLDIIHAGISGNKWYKLKYNIEDALHTGNDTILTFGGAYSNHIHAAAIAASKAGLKSIGVIRGERSNPLNPTLSDAENLGMKLHFISRSDYREKSQPQFVRRLHDHFGDFYLVPEGGTNKLAMKGASEILNEINTDFDIIVAPVGTGGTLSGLISGLKGTGQVMGISSLKGNFLDKDVARLVLEYAGIPYDNWSVVNSYHFGGYAKFTDELVNFINRFKEQQNIQLDPVYTGKMMYGLYDLVEKGKISPGVKIIAIHTGGLQGIRGFNQRFGELINWK